MVRAARREYDPATLEREVREAWAKEGTYLAARALRVGGPKWYQIDGPPYATGHIHIGTAWNKTMKDAVLRYKAARGFHVRDQPGFDMHGLPIEVKVEKELGLKNKKEIEERGVADFVERCRKFALDHLAIMTDEFKELGVWMDWDRPYMTITNEYMEGAWWALARAQERGLLYEAERVLSWCWRCETALAAAEVEHEDRKDPSVYVKFPLADAAESLVIWTTTPWTLPANVAIAVNPELDYARVRYVREGASEVLVVAAERAEDLGRAGRYESHEVLATFKGAELEGKTYRHPFADEVAYHRSPASKWNNRVVLGAHVAADRTGLVHTATGHGAEDFEVGAKYGVPVFSPVGEDGTYTDAVGPLAGLQVKGATDPARDADQRVIALLKQKGLLVSSRQEAHAYGHCWRCKNPIIFRATKQWFIDVTKIKERMLAETARVQWTPEWAGSARQADWVRQARDWCITRQRYWGIPVPVWKCSHGCVTVVGSRHALATLAAAGRAHGYKDGMDLHRPWIDGVTLACEKHGAEMRRVPDVLDVWFDSAVAAWSELAYPGHKADFEKWFPSDFILEGLDQTRGWFYSQLGAGVAAMDRVPYERVLMHGFVHDEKGRPMSKSLGNVVQPHDVVVKHGADAFRFHLLSVCAPWEDIHFGYEGVRTTERAFNILWNVHVFATQYMALDGWRRSQDDTNALAVEDRWLRSRTASLVKEVTAEMEAFNLHRATRAIERFVLEDLSRWYVRMVRDRVWGSDTASKNAAYATLHDALLTVSKLLAPFAPFIADAMYRDLEGGETSVHLADWPTPGLDRVDADLERDMGLARALVDAAVAARQTAQMKLRWPVAKLTVATDDATVRHALARFEGIVREQANAKAVEFVTADWEGLELEAVPNKNLIGKTLRADGPKVIAALRDADQATLKAMRREVLAGNACTINGVQLAPEMLSFATKLPKNLTGASFGSAAASSSERGAAERTAFGQASVYVDTVITPELEAEGYARELVRRIQEMRKELQLAVDAEVRVEVHADERLRSLVSQHADDVGREVRAKHLAFTDDPKGKLVKDWDIEGQNVRIGVG